MVLFDSECLIGKLTLVRGCIVRAFFLLAFLLSQAAQVSSANSAEFEPRPLAASPSWTGAYFGLFTSGDVLRTSAKSVVVCGAAGFLCNPALYPANGALLSETASGSRTAAAISMGAAAGHNWGAGPFVLGVETDLSARHARTRSGGQVASLNAGLVNPGGVPVVASISAKAHITWLGTLRARVGIPISPMFLVFATGGVAVAGATISNAYSDDWAFNGGAIGGARVRSNRLGLVYGGGVEIGLGDHWKLKAEHLHIDFRPETISSTIEVVQVPAAQNPFNTRMKLKAELFRIGASYYF